MAVFFESFANEVRSIRRIKSSFFNPGFAPGLTFWAVLPTLVPDKLPASIGKRMFGKRWNPLSKSPPGLRFKLSTLFVAFLALAIGLAIYKPYVRATMGEKFGMKNQAQTKLKIYWFKFDEPHTVGEPCEFAVITHDGKIVYVNDISPIW